jgi:hypothetical protein
MRLTIHTDHALRMLMLLALESELLHTIEDIARRYNISRSHLMVSVRATHLALTPELPARLPVRLGMPPWDDSCRLLHQHC